MLHFEAVPAGAVGLLKRLSAHPAIAQFSLAGGTSLALRFGHRISVDLDFFTTEPFDHDAHTHSLRDSFDLDVKRAGPTGVTAYIEGIKVDFVTYRYPLLKPVELIEGVRLFHVSDVTAMKLSALTNRGAKKDFYDLLELIDQFGVNELIFTYRQKFPDHDPIIMFRSLSYFQDAEEDANPKSLRNLDWPEVKNRIAASVKKLL